MLTGAGQRLQMPVSVFSGHGQRIEARRSAYYRAGQPIPIVFEAGAKFVVLDFFLEPDSLNWECRLSDSVCQATMGRTIPDAV